MSFSTVLIGRVLARKATVSLGAGEALLHAGGLILGGYGGGRNSHVDGDLLQLDGVSPRWVGVRAANIDSLDILKGNHHRLSVEDDFRRLAKSPLSLVESDLVLAVVFDVHWDMFQFDSIVPDQNDLGEVAEILLIWAGIVDSSPVVLIMDLKTEVNIKVE